MKIKTIVFLTLLFGQIKGQVALSKFSPVNFTIKVPTEIRGIANDSINKKGDFFEYNFKGVLYKNNEGLLPLKANGYKGNSNQDDPVKVIADFYFAYQSGNLDLLKKLINPEFKQKMEESNSLIDFEKKSAGIQSVDTVRVLCAFEVDGGYWVMSESKLLGIQNDFMVKKDGKYFITPSNNLMSTPRINNLMIYFTLSNPYLIENLLLKHSGDTLIDMMSNQSFILQLKMRVILSSFIFQKRANKFL